ncbi:glycerophosphodiester phosphodiesterase [Kitasatospora sp. NBC_00240]|uniref:glycerophosphodiester phosphodiesterase n=1 Tax=Kitasatospora sp. NBC_00240 TaxID=2903567 RepID=UPI002257C46A|nr:glycerophosphodiester phosphodiesterase [Kitasatospora sp. NBC_00240]MCX5208669.1 glycerophosphodiester phosphodiesterase [Kitasatospora sp. NBC_00240]
MSAAGSAGAGPRVLAVAHRGDPYRHRENTLRSVASALAAGADAVEVDVRLTRDGVPVLLHDATLERLWGDPRRVGSVTLDQLDAVGAGDLRVPTLTAALKAVADTPAARLLIDLDDAAPAAAARAAVVGLGLADRVAWCGPVAAMLAVRELDPGAEIALTWTQPRLPAAALLADLRPHYVNPPFGLVDPEFVAGAHEAGLAVSTWTADLRRTMRRLRRAGVDSITSNRIAVLRSVLGGAR